MKVKKTKKVMKAKSAVKDFPIVCIGTPNVSRNA